MQLHQEAYTLSKQRSRFGDDRSVQQTDRHWTRVCEVTNIPNVQGRTRVHMVGHPRCVFIKYIWLNQLSNKLICGTYMFIT